MTHGLRLFVYRLARIATRTCCDVKEDLVHLLLCCLLHVLPVLHAFKCVFHHFLNNASLGDREHALLESIF